MMNMKKTGILLCVFGLLSALPFVAQAEKAAAAPAKKASADKTLFERIGGDAAIDAAVEQFYVKVLADKSVNHFFEDINMNKQKKKQKAFIAAALGGPEPWAGKDMRKAHKNLDLKESDFAAIAGHLQATLVDLKVNEALIGEVMTVVGSTKDAVLNKKKKK